MEPGRERPRRILYTLPNFRSAGSGRALFEVARRLDRRLFEPLIAVASAGGRLEDEVRAAGIPVLERSFTLPIHPRATLWQRAGLAAARFRDLQVDLWHSLHYLDDYSEPLIARRLGVPFVYTKKNMSWNGRSWLLRSLLARRIAAQNTDMLKRFFAGPFWARAAWRKRVRLVPRGVDTARFRPGTPRSAGERLRLGQVAHLLPVKGQDVLIDAVAGVGGVDLELAGRPDDATWAARLEERIASKGTAATLVGEVVDVPSYLQGLDLFALPTRDAGRMEGCPVALLEAMACGLPVLASDIPGARDLVEHERSGLLVPAGDVDAWREAIRRLAGSAALRQALGAAARQRVVEQFPIECEVTRHQALYCEIVAG